MGLRPTKGDEDAGRGGRFSAKCSLRLQGVVAGDRIPEFV